MEDAGHTASTVAVRRAAEQSQCQLKGRRETRHHDSPLISGLLQTPVSVLRRWTSLKFAFYRGAEVGVAAAAVAAAAVGCERARV